MLNGPEVHIEQPQGAWNTDSAGGLKLGTAWNEWPTKIFIRVVFTY